MTFYHSTNENLVISSKSCTFAENSERWIDTTILPYISLSSRHLAKWGQRITADDVSVCQAN